MFGFPAEILKGVLEIVAAGGKGKKVHAYMKRAYVGPLQVPEKKSIQRYIKYLFDNDLVDNGKIAKIKEGIRLTTDEILEMERRLNISGLDPTQIKAGLQKMISAMALRFEFNSQLQNTMLDPRVEANMIKWMDSMRETYAKLLEIEIQVSSYEAMATLIVEKYLYEMASHARRAAEETYGSAKSKEFLEKLDRYTRGIDFDRIKTEANAEVIIMEKELASGTKKTRLIAS
jgi:hypothetical protein